MLKAGGRLEIENGKSSLTYVTVLPSDRVRVCLANEERTDGYDKVEPKQDSP